MKFCSLHCLLMPPPDDHNRRAPTTHLTPPLLMHLPATATDSFWAAALGDGNHRSGCGEQQRATASWGLVVTSVVGMQRRWWSWGGSGG